MIELLYLASQIQCGAGGEFLDIQVEVYQNQELIQTMSVDDRAMIPVNSINDLTFAYSAGNNNTGCSLSTPNEMVLATVDNLPNINGFALQDSVETILNDLNDYEELFLVELGTTNQNSSAFDLQDVVFRVNNNPNPPVSLYPD